jgi:3',5'-cyclic AMP phosphodiesterase CpdA
MPGGAGAGIPPLFELIARDLRERLNEMNGVGGSGTPPSATSIHLQDDEFASTGPIFVAATGDLTETASSQQFGEAEQFLRELARFAAPSDPLKRLFVVPGNHDVVFDEADLPRRWQPFCSFYSGLFEGARPPVLDRNALSLTQVHDRSDDGVIVAEVNSALYVRRSSDDAHRGQVDAAAIRRLREQLGAIDDRKRDSSVRIALMHHHPVLLPSLVEPGRNYDAIMNSNELLSVLQSFGFHIVLHGHKHYPQTFSYDPDYAWSTRPPASPILVVSGGSSGSTGLPVGTRATNSYNIVTIKWHPAARQARVRVETRGLRRIDEHGPMAPDTWSWFRMALADRVLRPFSASRTPTSGRFLPPPKPAEDKARQKVYETQRGNMLVADVMPSMIPDQAYEVKLWIVPHGRDDANVPVKVIWSAGKNFFQQEVSRDQDPAFCVTLSYWGPMLVEAHLFFEDGKTVSAFIYARIPTG